MPVILRGFTFPHELPEDIEKLRYQNGLEASTEFFDAFAQKLSEFFISKPHFINRIVQNALFKKVLPLAMALILAFGGIWGGIKLYESAHASFPVTQAEKNMVSEIIYYMSQNYGYGNIAMKAYSNALDSLDKYLQNPSDSAYNTLQIDLDYAKSQIIEVNRKFVVVDENLSNKIDTKNLPKDDIIALPDFLKTITDDMINSIEYMKVLAPDGYLSKTLKIQWMNNYKELMEINKDLLFYGANDILINVNEEDTKKLKIEIFPLYTYIYDGQIWRNSKEEIKAITDRNIKRYEEVVMELATYVGNENITTEKMEEQLNQLKEAEAKLQEGKERAKEKFRPLETDEPDILWGKMLRFNSLKMYEECIGCLEIYRGKANQEEAKQFIPIAIEFFKQVKVTGIDYGCLVGGYEPNKPLHSVYQIGDILIEMNGEPIRIYEDILPARGDKSTSYTGKILRFNGRVFETLEITVQPGESMVLYYDMCENIE